MPKNNSFLFRQITYSPFLRFKCRVLPHNKINYVLLIKKFTIRISPKYPHEKLVLISFILYLK